MGNYKNGDHVKIEVEDNQFGARRSSDDEQRLVFGKVDNELIANDDMKLGQQLAVSYDKIRDHKRFN